MNRELKLIFLKRLINVPIRILDKFLKFPPNVESSGELPQTRITYQIYLAMRHAYRVDCAQGTFGRKPDGNFERFLRVSAKLLTNISDADGYYRMWVGFALLLAERELRKIDTSPAALKFEIGRQWMSDLTNIPDKQVAACMEDFREWALCDYLVNLAPVS